MTKEVMPIAAKNLLEGKSGVVYRLFKKTNMLDDGRIYTKFYVKVPGRFFGWRWLKVNDSIESKMCWDTEAEARAWIESHKTVPRTGMYEEIPL
jgi:hypothetical protein